MSGRLLSRASEGGLIPPYGARGVHQPTIPLKCSTHPDATFSEFRVLLCSFSFCDLTIILSIVNGACVNKIFRTPQYHQRMLALHETGRSQIGKIMVSRRDEERTANSGSKRPCEARSPSEAISRNIRLPHSRGARLSLDRPALLAAHAVRRGPLTGPTL